MNNKFYQSHRLALWAAIGWSFLLAQMSAVGQGVTVKSNADAIAIQDNSKANPYPSVINVSGVNGRIGGVSVTLHNIRHPLPDDLDVLLRYFKPEKKDKDGNVTDPAVEKVILLMSDAGGNGPLDGTTLTFKDGVEQEPPPNESQINSGTFLPKDWDVDAFGNPDDNDAFPAPAPSVPAQNPTQLNKLIGEVANARWELFVVDDTVTDSGNILDGWSINLNMLPTIGVSNASTDEDTNITINFTVNDNDTSPSDIDVSVRSLDNDLVTNATDDDGNLKNLILGGSGSNRTLLIKPASNKNSGNDLGNLDRERIEITAKDGTGETKRTFNLTVNSVNDPPNIGQLKTDDDGDTFFDEGIDNISTRAGVAKTVKFRTRDVETAAGNLSFSINSSNENLVDSSGNDRTVFIFDDPDSNNPHDRLLRIAPVGSRNGNAEVTVTVKDQFQITDKDDNTEDRSLSKSATFQFTVNAINSPIAANTDSIALGNAVTKTINIPAGSVSAGARVAEVTLALANLSHTQPDQIQATLESPNGTTVNILNGSFDGTAASNVRVTFNDGGDPLGGAMTTGTFQPANPFDAFNNETIAGDWKLTVNAAGGSGQIAGGAVLTVKATPVISAIGNETINEDETITIDFSISDQDSSLTAPKNKNPDVQLSASATANAGLIQSLDIQGSGGNRSVKITPNPHAHSGGIARRQGFAGPATIEIEAQDETGTTVTETFEVTVTPVNDTPQFSPIQKQTTTAGIPVRNIRVDLSDVEDSADTFDVGDELRISTNNDKLLPRESIKLVRDGFNPNGPFDGPDGGTQTFRLSLFPIGVQTGTAVVTLRATDSGEGGADPTQTGTRSFTLTVLEAQNSLFTASGGNVPINIVDNANANPFPSEINVSGLRGPVRDIGATFVNFSHQDPVDVRANLVGPAGQGSPTITLMDGVGGDIDVDDVQLIFSDDAPSALQAGQEIESGAFQPTDPNATFESEYRGINPNGRWELRVQDVSAVGTGSIDLWTLNITTGPAASMVTGSPIEVNEDSQKATFDVRVGDNQEASQNFTIKFLVNGAEATVTNGEADFSGDNQTIVEKLVRTDTQVGKDKGVQRYRIELKEDQFGTEQFTVEVSNPDGSQTSTTNFTLDVNSVNDAPTISDIDGDNNRTFSTLVARPSNPIPFTVNDVEDARNSLRISVSADKGSLISAFQVNGPDGNGDGSVVIIPAGVETGTVNVTVTVRDSNNATDSSTFAFRIDGNAATAASADSFINISNEPGEPGLGPADPYPSTTEVKGVDGSIQGIRVILPALSHSFPQDLDIILEAPSGDRILLMSDVGGGANTPLNNTRITFEDGATTALPANGPIPSNRIWAPTDNDPAGDSDAFPKPGGSGNLDLSELNNSLDVLLGQNPNGTWSLLIKDDEPPDGGSLSGRWILVIETGPSIDLALPARNKDDDTKVASFDEDTDGNVEFTIGDSDTGVDSLNEIFDPGAALNPGNDNLAIRVTSDNPNIFDAAASKTNNAGTPDDNSDDFQEPKNWLITGSGTKRTLVIRPQPHNNSGLFGVANVTVEVSDGTNTAQDSFELTINPVNDTPRIRSQKVDDDGPVFDDNGNPVFISGIANQTTDEDPADPGFEVDFQVFEVNRADETADGDLDVTVKSLNDKLVPNTFDNDGKRTNPVIVNQGGRDRLIRIKTVANANSDTVGPATIEVTVTDDNEDNPKSRTASFVLTVDPVNDAPVILFDTTREEDGKTVPKTLTNEIDPQRVSIGETLTVNFRVRDVESEPKSLSADASVVEILSGPSGLIPEDGLILGGTGESRTLTIIPDGTQGGEATIQVTVTDPGGGEGQLTQPFTLTVGSRGKSFENSESITIRDNNTADPYPSTIDVPLGGANGVSGNPIHRVVVSLEDVNHPFPDDLDVLLGFRGTDSDGKAFRRSAILMSDAGGGNALSNKRLIFNDADSDGPNPQLPDSSAISGTTFRPTNRGVGSDNFPPPAPAGPHASALSTFNGLSPDGTWELFVVDDASGPSGQNARIATGWTLTLETLPTLQLVTGLNNDGEFVMNEDTSVDFDFNVDDPDMDTDLRIIADSSNTSLIKGGGLVIDDDDEEGARTLTLTPRPNQFGTSTITLTVRDQGDATRSVSKSFKLVVNNVNDAPTITRLSPITIDEDTSTEVRFAISDADGDQDDITVTAVSIDDDLIPNRDDSNDLPVVANPKGVLPGDNFVLTLNPASNANSLNGNTETIEVRVDDETAVTTSRFEVTIRPKNDAPLIGDRDDDGNFNPIGNITLTGGRAQTVNFNVGDVETAAGALNVTRSSGDTSVIPNDNIVLGGAGSDRTVRVTVPENAPFTTVTITLTVKDNGEGSSGARQTSTTFNVEIRESTAVTFASKDVPINIPDSGQGSFYPSTITVPDMIGRIGRIEVQLDNLSHTFPDDLDILLVSPGGDGVILMSDVIGRNALDKVDILFRDSAPALPDDGGIGSGEFSPTNVDNNDTFPSPAPRGPFGDNGAGGQLGDFVGTNPSGVWNLFLVDDTAGDQGSLAGWSLSVETGPEIVNLPGSFTFNEDDPNEKSRTLTFTVQDEDDIREVRVESSNEDLIPSPGVVLNNVQGSQSEVNLVLNPVENAFGSTTLTIVAEDKDGFLSTEQEVIVNVNQVNDAPEISAIDDQVTFAGQSKQVGLTIFDVETPSKDLDISITSSNQKVVPDANIVQNENGLLITPEGLVTGETAISIVVDDNSGADNSVSEEKFTLRVIENPNPVFTNGGEAITISSSNQSGKATPYPSVIEVSGLSGQVASATVTLVDVNHTFPDDFDILLVAPSGESVILMSDAGGDADISNVRLTFDDNATDRLPNGQQITSGDFQPTNINDGNDAFPDAPEGPHGDEFADLAGGDPNGPWRLYVFDDANQDAGSIDGGWILNVFTTAPTIGGLTDVETDEGTAVAVDFTVADNASNLNDLIIEASSSDQNFLPDANLIVSGEGAARTLTLTPETGQFPPGETSTTVTVTVTVTDDDGDSSSDSFDVTINRVDSEPTISEIADQTTNEDKALSVAFTVNDDVTPADQLVVEARAGNNLDLISAIVVGGSGSNRSLTITPAPEQSGTADILVKVTDGIGLSNSTVFTLTVNPVNDAPSISAIGNQTMDENSTLTVNFTVNDPDTPLGDLTVAATTFDPDLIPESGLALSGSGADRTLTITPAAQANGTAFVRISASDGNKQVRRDFEVTINPINDAPSISAIGNQTMDENTTLTVDFTVNDPDTPLDDLNVSTTTFDPDLIPEEGGLVLGGSGANRTLTITPAEEASGTAFVRIAVSDGNKQVRRDFEVTINAVNDAPSISLIPDQVTPQDTPITIPFAVTDPDTPVNDVLVSAISFEPGLVPDDNISIEGPTDAVFLSSETLSGANEVPPVDSPGTGTGEFILNGNDLNVEITYQALGSQIVAAHIHGPATPDENASVLVSLEPVHEGPFDDTAGVFSGTVTLTDEQRALLLDGLTYVNIHTVDNPPGELRGQISVEGDSHQFNLTVTPTSGQSGEAPIRVQARDESSTVRTSFLLTIQEKKGPSVAIREIPQDPGTGLNGRYWRLKSDSIDNIINRGGPKDVGLRIINNRQPTATFKATTIDYSGNDLTPVEEWLGDDAASLNPSSPGNLNDGLFSFNGWLAVRQAGTFTFSTPSDDGSIVWIAGQRVIDNDGSHGAPGPSPEGTFTFEQPGLYPVEIAYFNSFWINDAGDQHGGASIQFLSNLGSSNQQQDAGLQPVNPGDFFNSDDIGVPAAPSGGSKEITGDAGTGLSGRYWKSPSDSVDNLKDMGGEKDIGLEIINTQLPNGRFTSSAVNYEGDDLTPIVDWLNSTGSNDGDTFRGVASDLNDAVASFDGFIEISEPGEVTFTSESDDGSIVWIAGQKIIDNDGTHGPTPVEGSIFFGTPGLYPIQIAYFNSFWINEAGDQHGGASINFTSDGGGGIGNAGGTVPTEALFPAETTIELTNSDIGTEGDPLEPGSADISNPFPDVFDATVVAGGTDIWNDADGFHFAYTEWAGDFDMSVEVASLEAVNQWSKAGLMIREDLDADSKNATVVVTPMGTAQDSGDEASNNIESNVRPEKGAATTSWTELEGGSGADRSEPSGLPNSWVRLVRQGDTLTSMRSDNGVDWEELATLELAFPQTVFVGLATTSHNNEAGMTTTAEYLNFTVREAAEEVVEPPVMTIAREDGDVTIEWDKGVLQSAPSVTGPWANVEQPPGRGQAPEPVPSPFITPASEAAQFYRVILE